MFNFKHNFNKKFWGNQEVSWRKFCKLKMENYFKKSISELAYLINVNTHPNLSWIIRASITFQ